MMSDEAYILAKQHANKYTQSFFSKGKNLFFADWEVGAIDSSGNNTNSTTRSRTKGYIDDIIPSTPYTATFSGYFTDPQNTSTTFYVHYYNDNQWLSFESFFNQPSFNFVTPANTNRIRFTTYRSGEDNGSDLIPTQSQLEKGSIATDYEPSGLFISADHFNNNVMEKVFTMSKKSIQYTNNTVTGMAHRGYSWEAPECTKPAYTLAKEKGFRYVENDIQYTSDGIPVMFHDTTIDNKSNGSGAIIDHTLAELKALDFGSWKGAEFAGTQILTFDEYVLLCKKLNLYSNLDLKQGATSLQAEQLVNILKKYGMLREVSWLGSWVDLDNIRLYDEKARIGTLPSTAPTNLDGHVSRLTAEKNVFINVNHTIIDQSLSDLCAENGIGLETWVVNDETLVPPLAELNVQTISTDKLNIEKILIDSI